MNFSMNYKIRTFEDFDREFKRLSKRYHSLRNDLIALQQELLEHPDSGIDLGKGLRKVRMAIRSKGKGKSHGARVITYTIILNVEEGVINLLYIYDKAEKENITGKELEALLKRHGF